jgi:hypothetical protein
LPPTIPAPPFRQAPVALPLIVDPLNVNVPQFAIAPPFLPLRPLSLWPPLKQPTPPLPFASRRR